MEYTCFPPCFLGFPPVTLVFPTINHANYVNSPVTALEQGTGSDLKLDPDAPTAPFNSYTVRFGYIWTVTQFS